MITSTSYIAFLYILQIMMKINYNNINYVLCNKYDMMTNICNSKYANGSEVLYRTVFIETAKDVR